MLSSQVLNLLPLFAAFVSIVQATPIIPKQATRISILERASKPLRKRASPSGVTITSVIDGYQYRGQRDGYRGNGPLDSGSPSINDVSGYTAGAYTFSQALNSCAQEADSNEDGTFNLFYTASNDKYYCYGYQEIYSPNQILTNQDPTITYSYVYSQVD